MEWIAAAEVDRIAILPGDQGGLAVPMRPVERRAGSAMQLADQSAPAVPMRSLRGQLCMTPPMRAGDRTVGRVGDLQGKAPRTQQVQVL